MQFWKNISGKELNSSGEVIDVRPSKGAAEVDVANKSKPSVERINIRLIVPTVDQASVLKRGQQIKFKGYIDKSMSADYMFIPQSIILSQGNVDAGPRLTEEVRHTPGIGAVGTLRLGRGKVNGADVQAGDPSLDPARGQAS